MNDDSIRELFHGLIKILIESGEPFLVAARLISRFLTEAEDLRQEVGGVLVDMVMLAREEGDPLPIPGMKSAWRDLHELGRLRQRLQLDRLLSAETQECGLYAVPLLAIALFQVWSRLEVFYEWLEGADDLPMRLDARMRHLRSERRGPDRHRADDNARSSGDVLA
ncbi:MAG: hypothetical protein GY738_25290 [Pseudoalteromonas sp.]|nr:hypothetical protein [Pseudoalteromonas sp.]